MRLLELKDDGVLSLTKDFIKNVPPYAILSHTWGDENEEVVFEDLKQGFGKIKKVGKEKIQFCADRASRDGLHYIWVDTCCIDKSNSAELSEAIISMFRWYHNSTKCYVYLTDVSTNGHDPIDLSFQSYLPAFRKSRWFTRGWTLQELIAPPSVEFFSVEGNLLGDKKSLKQTIQEVTRIALQALEGSALSGFSVSERLSWAEFRETKREEDKAYSLLGMFNVHMPPLYGEGIESAFRRLREEINKGSNSAQSDMPLVIIEGAIARTEAALTVLTDGVSSLPTYWMKKMMKTYVTFHALALVCCLAAVMFMVKPEAASNQEAKFEVDSLISWLNLEAMSHQTNFDDALYLRHNGTGTWFLDEQVYQEWLSTENSLLWVYGIPGSGKTVLSATIIQNLQARAHDSRSGLIYFYVDHRDASKQTLQNFIHAGLNQLMLQCKTCTNNIRELRSKKQKTLDQGPNQQEYLQLFKSFTLHFERVFVVVDALDESSEVERFVDGLAGIIHGSKFATRAQILVTSRYEVKIQRLIKPIATSTYSLTANIKDDISRYISAEVHSRILTKKLQLRTPSLEGVIIDALSQGADGMFLWASLQLSYICSLQSDREIKVALSKLPRGLDKTYTRVLTNLKTRYYGQEDKLKQVLEWVLVASDRASLEQVAEAISIQPDDKFFDIDGVATDHNNIVAPLGSLITVYERGTATFARFAHYSIEEFLVSANIRDSNLGAFYINISMAHANVAKTCLQYLSFTGVPSKITKDNQLLKLTQHYQIYTYAANNWFYHLRESDIDNETFATLVLPHLDWFLYPSAWNRQYRAWEQSLFNLPHGITPGDNLPPFYYATMFGLDHVLDLTLPEQMSSKNAIMFGDGLTLLHLASLQGYIGIVQRLLQSRAPLNARTTLRNRTALRLAAENSHHGVVELLLKAGADPNITSNSGATPFYGAARAGCLRAMELLRDAGSDVDVRTWDDWTPLMEAVEHSHLEAVKQLIDWDVELEISNRQRITPLMMARYLDRRDIQKTLIDAIETKRRRRKKEKSKIG